MDIVGAKEESKNYGLHDSKVNKLVCFKENLIFNLDYIFEYRNGEEILHRGSVILENVDIDFCRVYLFDKILERGRFSGKLYYLKDFIEEFKNIDYEFEILSETYNGYDVNFEGWLWINNEAKTCFMTFWKSGEVIYRIKD